MSADNFGVVHRHGDEFGLSMGFASGDDSVDLSRPYFTGSLKEVVKQANSEYFEYGWSYADDVEASLVASAEVELTERDQMARLVAKIISGVDGAVPEADDYAVADRLLAEIERYASE